mmetsp:Transcript_50524/g.109550  ORF Transcript_50524/g.109550 Transcript_50524/m.109550 type:complete len:244 (-) Transcript_50524:1399-2130(-)
MQRRTQGLQPRAPKRFLPKTRICGTANAIFESTTMRAQRAARSADRGRSLGLLTERARDASADICAAEAEAEAEAGFFFFLVAASAGLRREGTGGAGLAARLPRETARRRCVDSSSSTSSSSEPSGALGTDASSSAKMDDTRACDGSTSARSAGTNAAPICLKWLVLKWCAAPSPKSAPQKEASSVNEWARPSWRHTTTRPHVSLERSTLYEQPAREKWAQSASSVGKIRSVKRGAFFDPSQP